MKNYIDNTCFLIRYIQYAFGWPNHPMNLLHDWWFLCQNLRGEWSHELMLNLYRVKTEAPSSYSMRLTKNKQGDRKQIVLLLRAESNVCYLCKRNFSADFQFDSLFSHINLSRQMWQLMWLPRGTFNGVPVYMINTCKLFLVFQELICVQVKCTDKGCCKRENVAKGRTVDSKIAAGSSWRPRSIYLCSCGQLTLHGKQAWKY